MQSFEMPLNQILLNPAHYQLSVFAVPVWITSAVVAALSVTVLFRERFRYLSRHFLMMALPVSAWLFSFGFMYASTDERTALEWAKIGYWFIPFIPSSLHYFSLKVLRARQIDNEKVALEFILSALFAALFVNTDLLLAGVKPYAWGYCPAYQPFSLVFLAFFAWLLERSWRLFREEAKKPQTPTHRVRVHRFLLALTFAYGGSVDFLVKFGIPVYPFGYLCVLGFALIAAATLLKYRLVDVTPSMAVEKIIGSLGDAVLVLDAEHVVRVANDAACELFGLSKDDILGKPMSAVSPGFPIKNSPEMIERVGVDENYEILHELADSRQIELAVSESAVKDHLGCVIAAVLIIRDVTAVRKTERALQESQTRCDELYRQIPNPIVVLDEFGRFRSLNPAAERMLGWVERRLVGKIFLMSTFIPEEISGKVMQVIRRLMEGQKEEPFEMELYRQGAPPLLVMAHPSAVREKGKVTGVQFLFRDLSENQDNGVSRDGSRKTMEREIQKRLDELTKHHRELKAYLGKFRSKA